MSSGIHFTINASCHTSIKYLVLCAWVFFFYSIFFYCVVYKVNGSEEKHIQNHIPSEWISNVTIEIFTELRTHTHTFLSSSNSVKSIQVESKLICERVAQIDTFSFDWVSDGVCVCAERNLCTMFYKKNRLQYTSDHCCWFGSWEYFILFIYFSGVHVNVYFLHQFLFYLRSSLASSNLLTWISVHRIISIFIEIYSYLFLHRKCLLYRKNLMQLMKKWFNFVLRWSINFLEKM